jgi:hypothetical protein
MGKIIVGIAVLVLGLFAFSNQISEGITNWRTDAAADNFVVTTGGGESTASVSLTSDLFAAKTSHVTSITSNITGEHPIATAYDEDTKVLSLAALNAGTSRSLVVSYRAVTSDEYMSIIGPFLAFLIFGGIVAAIIWSMVHKRRGY